MYYNLNLNNMYNDLIRATKKILKDGSFRPYIRAKFSTSHQFEVYFNRALLEQMGSTCTRNSVEGYGRRLFDLKKFNFSTSNWMVCEIGHEKSSRGYLLTKRKKPNKMGLINKLFFDYIKNYQYKDFEPESYAILYFSLEANSSPTDADNLIETIIKLYPIGHAIKTIKVIHNKILCGKILIIDHLNNIDDVRDLYNRNKHILQYINPIENGWNKHEILMGKENPW